MQKQATVTQILTVGFYVAFSLLIPTGIGLWFDKKASHAFPSFTLIGLAVGTTVMIYGVYRMVRPFLQEAREGGREEEVYQPIRKLLNLSPTKRAREKKRDND